MLCVLVLLILLANVVELKNVSANTLNNKELFTGLIERIDRLEARDIASKREIVALQAEMKTMETRFLEKEERLLSEIRYLKSKFWDNDEDQDVTSVTDITAEQSIKNPEESMQRVDMRAKEEKRSFNARDAVETEVAFYATHSQHDIQHLGQYQIIVFDLAVTNVGNAYNPHHGGFEAPVTGTYVFHVTMMGRDTHNVTGNHFNAYIDVDGTPYSQLWVRPYEQSSQMFVIELSARQTVTVKNHVLDDGFIGKHMSTFSGFLLYQHFNGPSVVG